MFSQTTTESDKKSSRVSTWIIGGLVVGVAVAVGAIAYFGLGPMLVRPALPQVASSAPDAAEVLGLNQSTASASALSEAISPEDKEALLQQIGQLVPSINEVPKVYAVLDVTKLRDNQFFAKAQNMDVIFIFEQSGHALLYRPQEQKIIEQGSVTAPSSQ